MKEKTSDTPKHDNHAGGRAAKIDIRRKVLEAIEHPRVFDAFAGSGVLHREVWHEAEHYVGCDTRWVRDGRLAFVADNRRVLRAIDLNAFNLFDLDAYGAPWEQAIIIAARRKVAPGEIIGLTFTEGTALTLNMNKAPNAMAQLVGVKAGQHLAGVDHNAIIESAIAHLARRWHCDVVSCWEARRALVRYVGLVLRGAPVATAPA